MVSEISGIGLSSMPASLGQAGAPQTTTVRNGTETFQPAGSAARVASSLGGFSSLAAVKDEATGYVQSVREVSKALATAEGVLQELDREVRLVKNYPPFPPGNEQRQDFINSLNGLRRQLESLTMPPVEEDAGLVFYPKQTSLPDLDPVTASDLDVAAFASGLDEARAVLQEGLTELRKAVDSLAGSLGIGLPQSGVDAAEAQILGRTVSHQVGDSERPIMQSSMALNDL